MIKLVFPTLWSPRRTILLRFKGGDEKSAVTGDVAMLVSSRIQIHAFRAKYTVYLREREMVRVVRRSSVGSVWRTAVRLESAVYLRAGDDRPGT